METIHDAIVSRRSVRDYDGTPLDAGFRRTIDAMLSESYAPFGGAWCGKLLCMDEADDFRPSTYGMIHGARNYIVAAIDDNAVSRMSAGYALERIVIEAQRRGLGTCWIAGTFRSDRFESAADLGLPVSVVIPVGVAARQGLVSRVARAVARSGTRRPFESLFGSVAVDSVFARPLALMRLAPSSTNSQPWRAIVTGDDAMVHMYNAGKRDMSDIDMGIGLCHFDCGCAMDGITGRYDPGAAAPDVGGAGHVTTFIRHR